MEKLGIPWDVVFDDDTTWQSAAAHVLDPALKELLSPPHHLAHIANSGVFNGYRKRLIAFDMMLQFELRSKRRFSHVMQLRPDSVVTWKFPSPPLSDLTCQDAVFMANDQLAFMPRNLAVYFFTHLAMSRSIRGLGPVEINETAISESFRRSAGRHRGTYIMPAAHLAFHGIRFYGLGLELSPNIGCDRSAVWIEDNWILRDDPEGNATCIRGSKGEASRLVDALKSMGVSAQVENGVNNEAFSCIAV